MTAPRIDGYEIRELLGSGTFADAYLAHNLLLDRLEVLKVLNERALANTDYVTRFRREARAIARVRHHNVVLIHKVDAEARYLAVEYCAGGDLNQRLARGPMQPLDALRIVRDVARGLAAAHEQRVIHRDVKPANILFRDDGSVVLADFGIARAGGDDASGTQDGSLLGTPRYMSPEQFSDAHNVDGRSDLYSLGVVLCEMLTGTAPYPYDTLETAINAHLHKAVPRIALGSRYRFVQHFVDRTMAKKPDQRYQTCEELARDLDRAIGRFSGQTTKVRPVNARIRVGWDRRRLLWASAAAGVAIGAAGYLYYASSPPADPYHEADIRAETTERTIPPPRDQLREAVQASAPLTIATQPGSARVELESVAGYAPGMLLPPGDYTARISAPGYADSVLRVAHGTTATVREVSLERAVRRDSLGRATYALTIRTEPEDAKVTFLPDNRVYVPGMTLPEDQYTIEVYRTGYHPVRRQVSIRGENARVSVVLEPVTVPRLGAPDSG